MQGRISFKGPGGVVLATGLFFFKIISYIHIDTDRNVLYFLEALSGLRSQICMSETCPREINSLACVNAVFLTSNLDLLYKLKTNFEFNNNNKAFFKNFNRLYNTAN